MTGIVAGRALAGTGRRIVVLDGARTIGAKILVAGGGRCNVTHFHVDETAYAGAPRPAIRRVLRRFDVGRTVDFFRELGIELKREATGKLFPVSDDARTVLNALLDGLRETGAELRHPRRAIAITAPAGPDAGGDFTIAFDDGGTLIAPRVVLATGGKSLPKSGSDGAGLEIARTLGHSITDHVFPSLVPLKLEGDHPLTHVKGVAVPAGVEVRSGTGKRLQRFENDLLCTHFGLSGPAVLDASRWWTDAARDDAGATFAVDWLPALDEGAVEALLLGPDRRGLATVLREHLPERLARTLLEMAGVDPQAKPGTLRREERRRLLETLHACPLPVVGDRGWLFAEVTAGGVPLDEIDLKHMASKRRPGLFLCGEICDVDGRIGGFNFQWAWASGYVAGTAAAAAAVVGDGAPARA